MNVWLIRLTISHAVQTALPQRDMRRPRDFRRAMVTQKASLRSSEPGLLCRRELISKPRLALSLEGLPQLPARTCQ